mgnify:CR=1 FL=1
MLQCFYPKEYLDSAYLIDFEEKYGQGYRGIIFDIDNTLVPHGLPADERAESLFKRLKAIGYKVTMLSNNKEPRVKMFCDAVDAPYIYKAGKPNPAKYRFSPDASLGSAVSMVVPPAGIGIPIMVSTGPMIRL